VGQQTIYYFFVADAQEVKVSAAAVVVTDLFADNNLPMHLSWLLLQCASKQYTPFSYI
jgi:hypothetical protein